MSLRIPEAPQVNEFWPVSVSCPESKKAIAVAASYGRRLRRSSSAPQINLSAFNQEQVSVHCGLDIHSFRQVSKADGRYRQIVKTTMTDDSPPIAASDSSDSEYEECNRINSYETEMNKHFKKIKEDDIKKHYHKRFLKKFPKANLHIHATGSVPRLEYNRYLKEDMEAGNMRYYNVHKMLFSHKKEADSITVEELFKDEYEHIQIRKKLAEAMAPKKDSHASHELFFYACRIGESIAKFIPFSKILCSIIEKAVEQNITYMEVMVDLQMDSNPPEDFIQIFNKSICYDDAFIVLQNGDWAKQYSAFHVQNFDDWDIAVKEKMGWEISITDPCSPVTISYISEIMRNIDDPNWAALFFAHAFAIFNLAQNDSRAVGLNIVGPEHADLSVSHFDDQMRMLGYLKDKFPTAKIALHGGETNQKTSMAKDVEHHINSSITIAKADRLGHGISIIDGEDDPEMVLKNMAASHCAYEACISSNECILGVKPEDHPFMLYMKEGILVTLNTDDEGITESDLTNEYCIASNTFGLSYSTIKNISRNALETSFLKGDSIYSIEFNGNNEPIYQLSSASMEIWDENLDPYSVEKERTFLLKSKKAAVQIKHERALRDFEKDQLKIDYPRPQVAIRKTPSQHNDQYVFPIDI